LTIHADGSLKEVETTEATISFGFIITNKEK